MLVAGPHPIVDSTHLNTAPSLCLSSVLAVVTEVSAPEMCTSFACLGIGPSLWYDQNCVVMVTTHKYSNLVITLFTYERSVIIITMQQLFREKSILSNDNMTAEKCHCQVTCSVVDILLWESPSYLKYTDKISSILKYSDKISNNYTEVY